MNRFLRSLAVVSFVTLGLALSVGHEPSATDKRRAVRERDNRTENAQRGRTEMVFLARYERLRTRAAPFAAEKRHARCLGKQLARAGTHRGQAERVFRAATRRCKHLEPYYGRYAEPITQAQRLADASGDRVDVVIY